MRIILKSVQSHVTHDQKQRYLFNELFLSFVTVNAQKLQPYYIFASSQLFLGGFSFVAVSFDRPSIGRYPRNVHLDSVPLMIAFVDSVIQWRGLEQICFRNSNGRSNGEGIAYIFHQFERRIECLYFLPFMGANNVGGC